jgi:thioredoxin-related protein
MSMRPVVDRIARQNAGNLEVIRLNAQDPVGADISAEYDLRVTPTFLLFDPRGKEILRSVGVIDPAEVSRALGEAQ